MIKHLTFENIHEIRKDFFNQIIQVLKTPPGSMDSFLRQAQYYVPPVDEGLILDERLGDFYIEINPSFSQTHWALAYSVWQVGNSIKIAVIISGEHGEQFLTHNLNDLGEIWGSTDFTVHRRDSALFVEWGFVEPEFFHSAAVRERFILGMRHMHFRVLRLLKKMSVSSSQ